MAAATEVAPAFWGALDGVEEGASLPPHANANAVIETAKKSAGEHCVRAIVVYLLNLWPNSP